MIHVIRVDPRGSITTATLSGVVARRIYDFVEKYDKTQDPAAFTGLAMGRLWSGDVSMYCAALVDADTGGVVGHLLAWYTDNGGGQKWGFISQALADGNVGDAMKRAFLEMEAWGKAAGCRGGICLTHRSPEAWAKYGMHPTHTMLVKEFEP